MNHQRTRASWQSSRLFAHINHTIQCTHAPHCCCASNHITLPVVNSRTLAVLPQVMSLVPGFSADLFPQGSDKAGQLKIKRYMTIMDSMTDKELDSSNLKELEKASRMARLARGSGRPLVEVQMLFEEFKRLGKIFNTALKGLKIPKNMKGGDINMNPRQMQVSTIAVLVRRVAG